MSDDGWNDIADSREDGWCTAGRPASYPKPTHIVIHCTGAPYDTARTRFIPPREAGMAPASAHYVIKRDTGEIVQFVKDLDRSWHAGITKGVKVLYRQGPGVWKKYLRYNSWGAGWVSNHYGSEDEFEVVDSEGTQVVKRKDGADWPQYAALEERFQRRLGALGVLPYLFADYCEATNEYSIGIEMERAAGEYTDVQYESLIRLLQNLCRTHGIEYDAFHIIGHEHTNPMERWGWDPSAAFDWERVLGASAGPTMIQGKTGFSVVRTPAGEAREANPLRTFYANEAGYGGFYPVGLRRNLHPGVHLYLPRPAAPPGAEESEGEAPTENAPRVVRASAPGYLVAARMQAASDQLQQLIGNEVGFVLLCHEFAELPPPESGEEERHAVFSLYMHLSPPAWNAEGDPYAHVGWLSRLRRYEHGSLVTIASQQPPGSLHWLAEEPEGELAGSVQVLGAEGEPTPLALGPKPEGSVCAVRREQPADVAQALKALQEGAVVTFDQPFLAVRAGEAIGYVQPLELEDHIPSGFVHWEFLAPKGKGLQKLTELAGDKLGLGAEFFPVVEDSDGDNHFSGNELEELLKPKLPQADQDALGDESLLRGGYEDAVLRLWHAHAPFSFADPAEDEDKVSWTDPSAAEGVAPEKESEATAPPPPPKVPEDPRCRTELTYPVTFKIENMNGLLDPAKHTLGFTVAFEPEGLKHGAVSITEAGDAWEITIQVPAVATRIVIEPTGDLLLDGEVEATAVAEVQKKAMQAVLAHRWRNVLLRHVSGWSKDGMRAILAKRFPDVDEIKAFYEPAAWWNLGKQDAESNPRGEVAVLGEEGQEKLLFRDEDDALLPATKQLDHLHPVTAAWLLNALAEAKAVRVVEEFELYSGAEESDEPLHWGWVVPGNAKTIALGSPLTAVVVTRGYGTGQGAGDKHQLTLKAKNDQRELTLGTFPLIEGVLTHGIELPLWGTWELAIDGHDGQPQSEIPRSIEVLAPAVAHTDPPTRDRQGRLTWALHFAQNRPRKLEGWVVLRVWTVDEGEEPAADDEGEVVEMGVPVDALATPFVPPRRGVSYDETGLFVTGASGPRVHLPDENSCCSLYEYEPAAAGEMKLKISLGRAVDAIGAAYGAWVSVRQLASDGLSVHLRCYKGLRSGQQVDDHNADNHQKLLEAAQGQVDVLDDLIKAEDAGETVRIEVRPPQGQPGPCRLQLDPSQVLARLVDEKAPGPGKQLKVKWGFLAPNGGRAVQSEGDPAPVAEASLDDRRGEVAIDPGTDDDQGSDDEPPPVLGESAVDLDVEDVKSKANQEVLLVWADAPSETLTKPQFGPIRHQVVGSWLKLEVDMFAGNMGEWWNAGPHFEFDGNEFGVKTKGKLLTTGQIRLDDAKIKGKQVSITATCRVDQPTIGGKQVTVPASDPFDFDARPRVEELTCTWDKQAVTFSGQTHCIPTDHGMALKITHEVEGEDVEILAGVASFTPQHGNHPEEGVITADGRLVARLPRHTLRDALAVGDSFSFSFYRPERLSKILGQDVSCEPKSETVPDDPPPEQASEGAQ